LIINSTVRVGWLGPPPNESSSPSFSSSKPLKYAKNPLNRSYEYLTQPKHEARQLLSRRIHQLGHHFVDSHHSSRLDQGPLTQFLDDLVTCQVSNLPGLIFFLWLNIKAANKLQEKERMARMTMRRRGRNSRSSKYDYDMTTMMMTTHNSYLLVLVGRRSRGGPRPFSNTHQWHWMERPLQKSHFR
jgi:hypothetical protein